MFVDSHCHLDCLKLDAYFKTITADTKEPPMTDEQRQSLALEHALQAANDVGVMQFLCVCIDLEHSAQVLALANRYEQILATIGVHPLYQDSAEPTVEGLVEIVEKANQARRVVVAVGETGLDYHYCPDKPVWQRRRFETHLQAALELSMPLVIHSRAAKEETLALFKAYQVERVAGVMHCYTEDLDMAKQCIDIGFYISISGIVTFGNASQLREVVAALPLDRLLIETDSPYLAPKPHRGKPNEPKYVVEVAKQVAALKGISVEEVATVTTNNYRDLIKF